MMNTANQNTVDVPLTHTDLLRLKRWYQSFLHDNPEVVEPADSLLDEKLRGARYDMLDRNSAALYAMRDLTSTKQHVGPERRSRVPATRVRVIRPAIKVALTH